MSARHVRRPAAGLPHPLPRLSVAKPAMAVGFVVSGLLHVGLFCLPGDSSSIPREQEPVVALLLEERQPSESAAILRPVAARPAVNPPRDSPTEPRPVPTRSTLAGPPYVPDSSLALLPPSASLSAQPFTIAPSLPSDWPEVRTLPAETTVPPRPARDRADLEEPRPAHAPATLPASSAAAGGDAIPPQASASAESEIASPDVAFASPHAPRFVHREMPRYPPLARRLGREGAVLLRLTIDEAGRLSDVEVLEGSGYGFTESALEAVRRSTFAPAVRDGRPVASRALLPVRFALRRSE